MDQTETIRGKRAASWTAEDVSLLVELVELFGLHYVDWQGQHMAGHIREGFCFWLQENSQELY